MRVLTLTLTLICSVAWSTDLSDKFRYESRVETIAGFSFTLYHDRLNAIGRRFDFEFGTLDHAASIKSPSALRIQNSEGEIIFDDSAPNFTRFFVIDEHLFAVEGLAQRDSQIWVFDDSGDIVFQGLAQRKSRALPIKISEEPTDRSEEVVILGCGPRSWITNISKLIYDRFGRLEGFFYEKYDELYTYRFQDFVDYQNQLIGFVAKPSFKVSLECPAGYSATYRYVDQYVSRWCENANGVKQGKFERWKMNQAFYDEKYQAEETPLVDAQLIKVAQGYYYNNKREGDWWRFNHSYHYNEHCQYVAGELNGQCISYSESHREVSPFLSGRINGTYQWFGDDGQLEEECEYKNGVMDGLCTYFDDKKVSTFCRYSGLYGPGVCMDYDKEGELEMDCQIRGQVEHGQCVNYSKGKVTSIDYYDAGEYLDLDE